MDSTEEIIRISLLSEGDIQSIAAAFTDWPKPQSTFDEYLKEQEAGRRHVWVAYYNDQLAGYITLNWLSKYQPFSSAGIPEIMDLNVLPLFRSHGIGSKLLKIAEDAAMQRSEVVGIGVGLYEGYGNAQKLYTARGYVPDGLGITYAYKRVEPGSSVTLDDDLVLWLMKGLIPNQ